MLHKPRIQQYAASAAWILILGASALALASIYGHERAGGLYTAALGFTIGLLCVLPVVYLMSASRSRSLDALVAGLELAREGQFRKLDEASVPPEFAPVAYSYNRMGAALEARQHELHAQLRHTALLTRLSLELRGSLDVLAILHDVLLVISSNTEADTASILLLAANGTVDTAMAITHGQISDVPLERANIIRERGLAGWALRNNRRVVLPDIAKDERWLQFAHEEACGSAIVLPLMYGRATLGVLTITHHTREHFTSKDLLLMEGVAAQASAAISAAQHHAEDLRRREQALVLLSMSQFLTSKRSKAALATELLQKSASVFEIYQSALFLHDRQAGQLACIATRPGQLVQNLVQSTIFGDAMAAAAGRAWGSQETIIDTLATNSAASDAGEPTDEVACVALPLLHNGDTIGAFVLLSPARGKAVFSARIWTLLTTFTNVAAAAFVNLQLLDQLHRRAELLEQQIEERTAQLKRSRDLLRIVFDHLPDGLVLLDEEARLLAANEAFCRRVLGLRPVQVIGRNYTAITQELERQALLKIDQQSLGAALRRVSCIDTVGQQRWYEVEHFTITVADAQQTIERWRDITQQEELKRKLRVHEQLTSIGQLAASVVHEIGNPLQGVRSCLDLCREDGALTPSAVEYLTMADNELERINNLLDRLRDIYRRSHGGAL